MKRESENIQAVMTTGEAAHYLGMSKSALDKARITGELFGTKPPEFVRFGRAIRYVKNELDDWLATLPRQTTLD